MAEVFAVFETLSQTRRAVRLLAEAGIPSDQVTVCSMEPGEEAEFLSPENRSTRIPLFALLGGAVGLWAGYLLPAVTARLMDLPTGGQPMVSLWAFGIVIFECTALGAIAGTTIALLWETGLFPFREKAYHDECAGDFAQSGWLVGVSSDHDGEVRTAQDLMQESGAKRIKVH